MVLYDPSERLQSSLKWIFAEKSVHLLFYAGKGLVANYGEGGCKTGGRGVLGFTPTKRGGGKSFYSLKGGAEKFLRGERNKFRTCDFRIL